jgi:hypothetical protein
MTTIMYDVQVERFELYYVQMMVVEQIMSNQYYKVGRSHFVCCYTSKTIVHEITTLNDKFIPSFPLFMPLDRVFQFTIDNDMYVGKCLFLFISSVNVAL